MTLAIRDLDAARRRWLEQLRQAHRGAPTASTAIDLARAEWTCGEFEASVPLFVEARDRAPGLPSRHLALLHAASMLALDELEDSALRAGRLLHPHDPRLALHAALRLLPGHFDEALALIAAHVADALFELYGRALRALADGRPPAPWRSGVPRLDAQWASFVWMSRHGGAEVFCGLPVPVLVRALRASAQLGTTLECGVYFGRSLRIIAAATAGEVHGFDSFQGLPEAWHANEPAGAYSTAGRLPSVPSNTTLHGGWFEQTLPAFFASHPWPIRLLHVDCDIHASTRTVLACAHWQLVPGSIVVFDDLLGYPGCEAHELRAFEEYVAEHGVRWELIAGCLLGRVAAIRITGP